MTIKNINNTIQSQLNQLNQSPSPAHPKLPNYFKAEGILKLKETQEEMNYGVYNAKAGTHDSLTNLFNMIYSAKPTKRFMTFKITITNPITSPFDTGESHTIVRSGYLNRQKDKYGIDSFHLKNNLLAGSNYPLEQELDEQTNKLVSIRINYMELTGTTEDVSDAAQYSIK